MLYHTLIQFPNPDQMWRKWWKQYSKPVELSELDTCLICIENIDLSMPLIKTML